MQLTLEQELAWVQFCQRVAKLSEAEAKAELIDLYKKMMQQDTYYKTALRQQWGI